MLSISAKKMQDKGYYAVRGHSRSSRYKSKSHMRLPISDYCNWYPISYLLELSQLINWILDTLRFEPHFERFRDNVRCSSWAHWKVKARSGLPVSVNWPFFARCYDWVATSEKRYWKSAISLQRGQFDRKYPVEGITPPIIFARIFRPMNAYNFCRWQFSHKETL